MARVKEKKGSGMAKVLIIVLVILVIIGVVGKFLIYDKVKEKAIDKVSEKIVEQMLENSGSSVTSEKVQQILNSISEEDKAKVQEIVGDSLGISDVPAATEYISNNDLSGLKEYVKGKLSDNQIEQLYSIYQKYN